jgi:ketopantoate reductase
MCKDEQLYHTCLHRIANTLLINGGYLPNLGLYSGDMGIVLFFNRYARFAKNEIYAEYSADLLGKIQEKVNLNTAINYKQGLSGIGATIEYLAQNGFLKIDTDDLLDDFDKRIFFTFNLSYLSIDKIADIGYYALWRLSGNSTQNDMIIKSVMPQIVKVMEEWQTRQNVISPAVSFFNDLIMNENYDRSIISNCIQLYRNNSSNAKHFMDIFEQFSNHSSSMNTDYDLGIQTGLAGLGLHLISRFDSDDSWLSLLQPDLFPNKFNEPVNY